MSNLAFSYVRFSSEKQEMGDSLRRQMALAEKYAEDHDLILDNHSYQDLAVSAFKGINSEKGKLKAFLEAVEKGRIRPGSYLLVESLDRISRAEVDEALDLFMDIIRKGIVLVTLSDGVVYSKASLKENWTKFIIALAVMSRANDESQQKATRVAAAWQNKRSEGKVMTAMAPAWLETSVDAKGERTFKVVKAKADIVRKVFKLALDGNGAPNIAKHLNTHGIPTPSGKAKEWSTSLVTMLLRKEAVMGRLVTATGDPIDDYYPVIVTKDQFYQVRSDAAGKGFGTGNRSGKVANIFPGLIYCECGRKMKMSSIRGGHRYLRCISALSGGGCSTPTAPYKAIEDTLFTWLVLTDAPVVATEDSQQATTMQLELDAARKRHDNLLDLAESGSTGVGKRLVKLEAEIAAMEKAIASYVPPTPINETWLETLKLLEVLSTAADPEPIKLQLQVAFRRIVDKIVVYSATHDGRYGKYREINVHGPIATPMAAWIQREHELLKTDRRRVHNATKAAARRVLPDGSPVVEYDLMPLGPRPGNQRGGRKKALNPVKG